MTDRLTELKEAAEKYNAANAELAKSHLEGTHTPEKTKAMIAAFDAFHDACDSEVIVALLAENAKMREALEPFAAEAEKYDDEVSDEFDTAWNGEGNLVGDLRRARAALEKP